MIWMDPESISQVSQMERQIPYDFPYMGNLRNKTDEHWGREGKIK